MIDKTNEPNNQTVDKTQETTSKTGSRIAGGLIVAVVAAGFFLFAPALAFIGGSVILMLIAGAVLAGLVYRLVR